MTLGPAFLRNCKEVLEEAHSNFHCGLTAALSYVRTTKCVDDPLLNDFLTKVSHVYCDQLRLHLLSVLLKEIEEITDPTEISIKIAERATILGNRAAENFNHLRNIASLLAEQLGKQGHAD